MMSGVLVLWVSVQRTPVTPVLEPGGVHTDVLCLSNRQSAAGYRSVNVSLRFLISDTKKTHVAAVKCCSLSLNTWVKVLQSDLFCTWWSSRWRVFPTFDSVMS